MECATGHGDYTVAAPDHGLAVVSVIKGSRIGLEVARIRRIKIKRRQPSRLMLIIAGP